MTHFFLSVHQEKKWVILTLNVESLAELKFDLKSWVTGGTKIRPNFFGQMTQFFSQCTVRKKWVILILKVVIDGTKIWPNFLYQNDL